MTNYRDAADCLARGRALRLAGNIKSALRHEERGEELLKASCLRAGDADDLLSAWECSQAESPLEIEEWRATGAFSLEEQLEAGYLERLPHTTGGGL